MSIYTHVGGLYKPNVTSVVLVNNTTKTSSLVVPTGKRWLIMGGILHNGDDVARNCSVSIKTSGDVWLQDIMASVAIAAGAERPFPRSDQNDGGVGPSAYPVMAFAGEKVVLTFAAGGAAAGGTENSYLRVLESIENGL